MSDSDLTADPSQPYQPSGVQPWLEVVGSRYLLDWLAENRVSLALRVRWLWDSRQPKLERMLKIDEDGHL